MSYYELIELNVSLFRHKIQRDSKVFVESIANLKPREESIPGVSKTSNSLLFK